MAILDPTATTVGDLCLAALRECGALGVGQTALADDLNDAWARLQWMLQQWERKRWLVYHLVTLSKVSTGQRSYTVGPHGSDFDTNIRNLLFDDDIPPEVLTNDNPASESWREPLTTDPIPGTSVRPARLESAFVRLINSPGNQPDYPLTVLQSREDYNRIALKSLSTFPNYIFLDSDWPLGTIHVWPIPPDGTYEIHISILAQLPFRFQTITTRLNLPYEYYAAVLYNLALRLRPKYRLPTFPGDPLLGLAKDSINVLRGANLQIAQLAMPRGLVRGDRYNILSDQFY